MLNDERLNRAARRRSDREELGATSTRWPTCSTTCSAASGRRSDAGAPKIDPYRRQLQNNYLTTVDGKLNPTPAQAAQLAQLRAFGINVAPLSEDAKSELRGALVALRQQIRVATPKAADRETRMHLTGVDHRIGEILDPKK